MCTFVSWGKGKGKGKGGNRHRQKGKGKGRDAAKGSPTSPTGGQAGGKGFNGDCNHCGKPGHMKWQCPELDKTMKENRAAAAVAGGKGKGKAAMELGNEWSLQALAAEAHASGAVVPRYAVFGCR